MMSEDTSTPEGETKKPAATAAKKSASKRKATTAKKTATKAASKKATTKKPATKKTTTKKATAKKAPAKSAAAKTSTVKKTASVAKKTTPKASTATTEAVMEDVELSSPNKSETTSEATVNDSNTGAREEKTAYTSAKEEDSFDHEEYVKTLKAKDWSAIFKRAILMLLYGFITYFAIIIIFVLSAAQLILKVALPAGEETPAWLPKTMNRLKKYIGQMLDYMTFKTEITPFPLDRDFPSE